jgi:hypothetical protein
MDREIAAIDTISERVSIMNQRLEGLSVFRPAFARRCLGIAALLFIFSVGLNLVSILQYSKDARSANPQGLHDLSR